MQGARGGAGTQSLGSAASTNCGLAELPSGIYALQAKRTTPDHPVWQPACKTEGVWNPPGALLHDAGQR